MPLHWAFSGIIKSGRVWRKVPESDARSVGIYGVDVYGMIWRCLLRVMGQMFILWHFLWRCFALVILWHDVEVFTTWHEVDVYLWHGVEVYLMV